MIRRLVPKLVGVWLFAQERSVEPEADPRHCAYAST